MRGFMHLVRYRRGQEALMEVPPSIPAGVAARPRARGARSSTRRWPSDGWLDARRRTGAARMLSHSDGRAPRVAATPDEVARRGARDRRPGRAQDLSPDITHKSDVGGVVLGICRSPRRHAAAAATCRRASRRPAPNARLDGFLVQEMVQRPRAHELIVGMAVDRDVRPVRAVRPGRHGGRGHRRQGAWRCRRSI